MKSFNINLTKSEIEMLLSSLLFTSSINVVLSEDITEHSKEFLNLAKKLKENFQTKQPNLKYIKFVHDKNQNFQDSWSDDVLNNFAKNLETVELEQA